MAEGPGKYDKLCTWVRERAKAQGIILVVFGGEKGHGFSAQFAGHEGERPAALRATANAIRDVAAQIERDAAALEAQLPRN